MREVHESFRRTLSATHPDSLGAQRELASLLHTIGKVAEAEECAREAVLLSADTHGVEHPSTRASETLLAEWLRAQGRVHESLPLLRQLHGDRHPRTLSALCAGADVSALPSTRAARHPRCPPPALPSARAALHPRCPTHAAARR